MLDIMRKYSKSFLIYILFGIIIVVFIISFGPGSKCTPGGEIYAAWVNGDGIFLSDFKNLYNHNPMFRNKEKDTSDLRREALELLVRMKIMKQEAARRGFMVTNEELIENVHNHPDFQDSKTKAFNVERYKQIARYYYNMDLPKFEAWWRDRMLSMKMQKLLLSAVTVSDTELLTNYLLQRTQANLEFVEFTPQKMKARVFVAPGELKSFKKKNYKRIEDYFKRKKYLFKARSDYKTRQILLRVAEKANKEAVKAIKAKMDGIHKEALKGDFAKLAAKYSEDPSKANGGAMGFVERRKLPKGSYQRMVLTTPKGAVSRVFKDKAGYRIIKVEDVRDKKLTDVEDEIARDLIKMEKAGKETFKKANGYLKRFKKMVAENPGTSLKALFGVPKAKKASDKKTTAKKADAESGYTVKETGPFSFNHRFNIPRIGPSMEIMRAAFTLTEKAPLPDRLFKLRNSLYLVKLLKINKPDLKKFNEEKQQERRFQATLKGYQVFSQWYDKARKQAKVSMQKKILLPPDAFRKKTEEVKGGKATKKEKAPLRIISGEPDRRR